MLELAVGLADSDGESVVLAVTDDDNVGLNVVDSV